MIRAKILTKPEEDIWDKFAENHPLSTIHQASIWGHFQEKINARGKYWIIALKEDGKIIGGTMLIRHLTAKGHSWLYAARGPLLNYKSPRINEYLKALLTPIKKLAEEENSIFLRIDPPLEKLPPLKGFYSSSHGFQPQDTLILDLRPKLDDILAQMKPKGRYNIRLAEKKGVTVRKSNPKKLEQFLADIESFHRMLNETTQRDKFSSHKKEVYRDMIDTLNLENRAALYLAEYEGEPIAGIIVTFYKDTAIYYYGASSNEHRNLMAPYLLQWQAIQEAKSRGLTNYDFLGIAPPNAKNHPWRGVTDFKEKFGGQHIAYTKPQEHPFQKLKYFAYRLYKFIKG
ncbi:peptidoglycan bridge formation glycyltransferase FemA/FemB family protein [Patescibacteria group bacterium]|nr:peptidoglycan bridge formation glycyltransferase FemA/FemB family protein [Patescibacteria group bacterium]